MRGISPYADIRWTRPEMEADIFKVIDCLSTILGSKNPLFICHRKAMSLFLCTHIIHARRLKGGITGPEIPGGIIRILGNLKPNSPPYNVKQAVTTC